MLATVLLVLYVFAMLLPLGILALSVYLRRAPRSLYFSYMLLSVFVFTLGYIFEITAPTLEAAMIAARVQYMGIPFISPLLVLFIMEYCGYTVSKKTVVSALAVPLAALVLMQTYPLQTLFYSEVAFDTSGVLPHLVVTGGVFYYIFFFFQYVVIVAALGIVLYHCQKGDAVFIKQSYLLLAATLAPFISNFLGFFGVSLYGLDTTPLFFTVTCLLLACLIFMLGMYRVAPIVREQIVETMSDGFVLVNMQNHFIDANQAAKNLLPSLAGAGTGTKMSEVKGIPWVAANKEADRFEFSIEQAGGGQKHYRLSETVIRYQGRDAGRSIMIYDITESRRLLDEVSMLAERDALTGQYNRHTLRRTGEELFNTIEQAGGEACLLMMDLDSFKDVNDAHGHLAGDEVLKTVSGTLVAHLQKGDLFARYGGEEFCALMPGTNEEDTRRIAEDMRRSVEGLVFESEQGAFRITISIGFAAYNSETHSSFTALMADADTALYTAKGRGKNCVAGC